MTGRLALALLQGRARGWSFDRLTDMQKAWKAEQSASLQKYFRSAKAGDKQDPSITISGEWPVQATPAPTEGEAS